MRKLKICLILIGVLLFSHRLVAQEKDPRTNMETWSSIALGYDVNKAFRLSLRQEARIESDFSTIKNIFSEVSLSHKLGKFINGSLGYRYIRNNDTKGKVQGYENLSRIHADLCSSHDINRLNLGFRLRLQSKTKRQSQGQRDNRLRLKMSLRYNIRKWKLDPAFSTEFFRKGKSPDEKYFDKIRMTLSTRYKTKSAGKFGVFYRIESRYEAKRSDFKYIVGIKYSYKIKI